MTVTSLCDLTAGQSSPGCAGGDGLQSPCAQGVNWGPQGCRCHLAGKPTPGQPFLQAGLRQRVSYWSVTKQELKTPVSVLFIFLSLKC